MLYLLHSKLYLIVVFFLISIKSGTSVVIVVAISMVTVTSSQFVALITLNLAHLPIAVVIFIDLMASSYFCL